MGWRGESSWVPSKGRTRLGLPQMSTCSIDRRKVPTGDYKTTFTLDQHARQHAGQHARQHARQQELN